MKIKFEENELERLEDLFSFGMIKHNLLPENSEGQNYSISFTVKDPIKAEYFIRELMYGLSTEDKENIGIEVTAFSLYDYTERDRIIQKMQNVLDELTGRKYADC